MIIVTLEFFTYSLSKLIRMNLYLKQKSICRYLFALQKESNNFDTKDKK